MMQQHGDGAADYAAEWATALLEAGNHEEARRFDEISRAIRTLSRVVADGRAPPRRSTRRRAR